MYPKIILSEHIRDKGNWMVNAVCENTKKYLWEIVMAHH